MLLVKDSGDNMDEELIYLIKKAQCGDNDAAEKILLSNKGLVYRVVKKYVSFGDPNRGDLIQVGTIAMWEAIRAFDFSKEVKFSTAAVPYINTAVRRAFQKSHTYIIPIAVQEVAFHVKRRISEYYLIHGVNMTRKMIQEEFKLFDYNLTSVLLFLNMSMCSYDGPLPTDKSDKPTCAKDYVGDTPDHGDNMYQTEAKDIINGALNKLSPKMRLIFIKKFYERKKLADIAADLDMQPRSVANLITQGKQKLRKNPDLYELRYHDKKQKTGEI